jgi:N-formylglutamate amidohydrolase
VSCSGEDISLEPNQVVYGADNFTEYIVGDDASPIIITAPHGGYDAPSSIPDRTSGVTEQDLYTQELARDIVEAIFTQTGLRPHIIINKLHRRKMDANRPSGEAADGNNLALKAWEDYHCFIDIAKKKIQDNVGKGILFDMHGHGHGIDRIEVGYLLDKFDLGRSDADLNSLFHLTSIKALVSSEIPLSTLIRGEKSFGTLIAAKGFPAVPSTSDRFPSPNQDYFEGGYTTQRHGSVSDGVISAIQLECNRPGLRDTDTNRKAYAAAMAEVVKEYLQVHYGLQ